MLQLAEVFPHARQTIRRRAPSDLESEVIAGRWDAPRVHRVLDLSERGMRVASGTRLARGEHVVLSFVPPGWWLHGELTVFAKVVRETARGEEGAATMGFEFVDLSRGAQAELARCLRGLPPPLPRAPRRVRKELVWVDVLVTYTEDLGDRVNTFEVSERIAGIDAAELEVQPLAGLVTGGRAPYAWRHTA
ncbi:MAG: PilZ domain-containing protein [Sandaracinaceae bacterium]|nr:PilZ domain-containing protein [Sandaracinaceae bacterium]